MLGRVCARLGTILVAPAPAPAGAYESSPVEAGAERNDG